VDDRGAVVEAAHLEAAHVEAAHVEVNVPGMNPGREMEGEPGRGSPTDRSPLSVAFTGPPQETVCAMKTPEKAGGQLFSAGHRHRCLGHHPPGGGRPRHGTHFPPS